MYSNCNCNNGERKMILSALSVALLGYACGMVLALPGVVLAQWELQEADVILSTTETSWFVSIVQLVSIPGSILGGMLIERIGPRRLALYVLPLSGVMWVLVIKVVYFPWIFIACRALHGFFNIFLCVISCLYPCEIADVKRRGFLGSFVDASFSLGFLTIYLIGGIVKWQQLGYVAVVISVLPCYLGVYLAPESPIWLVRHGQFDQAVEEMKRIRASEVDVEKELLMESERAQEELNVNMVQHLKLMSKCRYLLPVLATITLLALKEATGQFALAMFVFQIFQTADSSISSFWCSIVLGSMRLLSNIVCSILLNKTQRRFMIGVPSLIAAVSLCLLGSYFCFETLNTQVNLRFLPLTLLMVYVVCYGIGIGPTCWLLAAEMQPSAVRSTGSGLAQGSFNFIQWLIAGSFVTFEKTFGLHILFWIFAGGCLLLALFVVLLPETKGKTFNENEKYWIRTEEKLHSLFMKICRKEWQPAVRYDMNNVLSTV